MKRARRYATAVGLTIAAAGAVMAAAELPYVNWKAVAPPLAASPLMIWQDAKGDGRFEAPRSGNRLHRGIDFAAALDTPVQAVRSGRVLEAGNHRGLGRFVVLQHGGGLRSLYAHLNATLVKEGVRVRQGAVIGTVGKTGNARHPWITPHVHFEVVRNDVAINPASLGLEFQLAD
jgi:murein DD-endopeptidase MepM/ murein hydrolase activator NlpD